MFDFLCLKLSALQNNLAGSELRLAQIMISNTLSAWTGRQVEIEVRQVQRGEPERTRLNLNLRSETVLYQVFSSSII